AQEFSATAHHRDAAVDAGAFAIGGIDIAILWIGVDAGRHEELRGVGIQRLSLYGAIVGIFGPFLADLKPLLASVIGIFLPDAGWLSCDPYIVVLVDVTAMEACIK